MIGILLGLAVLGGAAFGGVAIAIAAVFGLAGLQLGWLRPIPAALLALLSIAGFWRAGGGAMQTDPPSWAGARSPASGTSRDFG